MKLLKKLLGAAKKIVMCMKGPCTVQLELLRFFYIVVKIVVHETVEKSSQL